MRSKSRVKVECPYRLIAVAGFQAYRNTLVGNPAPVARLYQQRASSPRPGDLVVEASTIYRNDWSTTALGELLRIEREPIQTETEHQKMLAEGDYWKAPNESFDSVPTEVAWYVRPLDESQPQEFRWHNADFIAIPWEHPTSGAGGNWPEAE